MSPVMITNVRIGTGIEKKYSFALLLLFILYIFHFVVITISCLGRDDFMLTFPHDLDRRIRIGATSDYF
jgi:hypothetical protein